MDIIRLYAMSCYVMLCYAMLCCVVLCWDVMLCYGMLCDAMLCYVMLWSFTSSCDVMLCYVKSCYVMLRYVMLRYVMLWIYICKCKTTMGNIMCRFTTPVMVIDHTFAYYQKHWHIHVYIYIYIYSDIEVFSLCESLWISAFNGTEVACTWFLRDSCRNAEVGRQDYLKRWGCVGVSKWVSIISDVQKQVDPPQTQDLQIVVARCLCIHLSYSRSLRHIAEVGWVVVDMAVAM